jgi:hypothetical protein
MSLAAFFPLIFHSVLNLVFLKFNRSRINLWLLNSLLADDRTNAAAFLATKSFMTLSYVIVSAYISCFTSFLEV